MDILALPHNASKLSSGGIRIHFGIDRLTFWLDQDARTGILHVPGDTTRATSRSARMPMNPLWRTPIDVTAPTSLWLRHLGQDVAFAAQIHITYVELAVDVSFKSPDHSTKMQAAIIGHTKFMHRRDALAEHMGTYYCGKRSHAGTKNAHVVALYADRPSKMGLAQGLAQAGICMHLEHRLSGSSTIAAAGIRTMADLIQFDHVAYHAQNNRIFQLPSQTELGRLLAAGQGHCVADAALRKRARKWRAEHQLDDGTFFLHNALRGTSGLERHLQRAEFLPWLKSTAARIASEK